MDLASRTGHGWVLAVLLAGAGCQSEQDLRASSHIEYRKEVAAEHQTRAKVGYEAIAARVDAAVERMATALADHEYRGGPYDEHLKHPGVVAAGEIAAALAKDVGARCLDASVIVGTGTLTFVESGCEVEARCHADAYELPGVRVESCDMVIDGKQIAGLGIEVTRALANGELLLKIRAPAA